MGQVDVDQHLLWHVVPRTIACRSVHPGPCYVCACMLRTLRHRRPPAATHRRSGDHTVQSSSHTTDWTFRTPPVHPTAVREAGYLHVPVLPRLGCKLSTGPWRRRASDMKCSRHAPKYGRKPGGGQMCAQRGHIAKSAATSYAHVHECVHNCGASAGARTWWQPCWPS